MRVFKRIGDILDIQADDSGPPEEVQDDDAPDLSEWEVVPASASEQIAQIAAAESEAARLRLALAAAQKRIALLEERSCSRACQQGEPLVASGGDSPLRSLAGWTCNVTVKAVSAAIWPLNSNIASLEDGDDDPLGPAAEIPSDVRNRPFHELVRKSMAEARAHNADAGGGAPKEGAASDAAFETWLREFHNERDDEWYAANYSRVYPAFRPYWDDGSATRPALSARM